MFVMSMRYPRFNDSQLATKKNFGNDIKRISVLGGDFAIDLVVRLMVLLGSVRLIRCFLVFCLS